MHLIIRCKCFFLFIGREPTTWLANNCLQIMVCSCAMSFNCFWLKSLAANTILLKRKWNHVWSLLVFVISVITPGRQRALTTFRRYCLLKTELGCRKISGFVSVSPINCLPQPSASVDNWSARHWQITIFYSNSSSNCSLFAPQNFCISIVFNFSWDG